MHRRAAFTLIELLLSLALLALVATLFISGATNFLRLREHRPDEDFWHAVTAARQQALDAEQVVTLQFDPDTHQLAWSWPGGHDSAALPGVTLRFLAATKGATKLLGGIVTETDAVPAVHFYPDGTCDAFRAELTGPDGQDYWVAPRWSLCANNAEVLRDAAVKGRGIAVLPVFLAEKELKSSALVTALDDYKPPQLTLYAIYPPTRHLSVKVRLFIDFLVERMR